MSINTPNGPASDRAIISHDDYVRLVGLLTLASDYRQRLTAIERSLAALVGEAEGGHASDAVWGGYDLTADQLLGLVGLTVAPQEGR